MVTEDVQPTGASKDEMRQTLKALVRRATASFLVPPEEKKLFANFDESIHVLRPTVQKIAEAFRANILGLLTTVSFPYRLAHSATVDRHYQRIVSAERIRSLMLEQKPGESDTDLDARREAVARKHAKEKMEEFVSSSEGANTIIHDSLSFLERSKGDAELSASANELILQGVVLCWGAFEVLVRDAFVALLNHEPHLVENLVNDPVAKRRFDLAKIPLETLSQHDFDLSGKMGDILGQQQDLSDIQSVKAVYGAIFPKDATLRDALSSEVLRVLSQRRNLIVHRRGLIDDAYFKAVAGNQEVGERLRILPDELEKSINCSMVAASAILAAVSSQLKQAS